MSKLFMQSPQKWDDVIEFMENGDVLCKGRVVASGLTLEELTTLGYTYCGVTKIIEHCYLERVYRHTLNLADFYLVKQDACRCLCGNPYLFLKPRTESIEAVCQDRNARNYWMCDSCGRIVTNDGKLVSNSVPNKMVG